MRTILAFIGLAITLYWLGGNEFTRNPTLAFYIFTGLITGLIWNKATKYKNEK